MSIAHVRQSLAPTTQILGEIAERLAKTTSSSGGLAPTLVVPEELARLSSKLHHLAENGVRELHPAAVRTDESLRAITDFVSRPQQGSLREIYLAENRFYGSIARMGHEDAKAAAEVVKALG